MFWTTIIYFRQTLELSRFHLVGNVSEYTIKGLSIDEVVLGVRAVDRNGNESLVAAYVDTPYKQRKWETSENGPVSPLSLSSILEFQ